MSGISAQLTGRLGQFMLDAALDIPGQGITSIFGPSGCGKTTLLRCIAGLTNLPGSFVRVGRETWQEGRNFRPPHERPVGFVFQDARLFAHITVENNLRFGLRRAGEMPRYIQENVVIAFLGLAPLLARYPATLSGGERQRVAIGRALLSQPQLMLMDEPLAALDRETAHEILPKLREISGLFGLPIIHVSHDLAEIERLADYLVLMRADGRIAKAGKLGGMLTDLALPFAARQDAAMVLELTAGAYDAAYGLTLCHAEGLSLIVPGQLGPEGSAVRLRVRASDVSLAIEPPRGSSVLNILPARILVVEAGVGPNLSLVLGLSGAEQKLLCSITRKSWDSLGLEIGSAVFAQVKGVALAQAR